MALKSVRGRVAVTAMAAVTAASLTPLQGSAAAPSGARDTVEVTGTVLVLAGEDGEDDRYSLQLPSGGIVDLADGFEADPLSSFSGTLALPGTSAGARLTGAPRATALRRAAEADTPLTVVSASSGPGGPAPGPTSHTTYVAKVTNFGTTFGLTDQQVLDTVGASQQYWVRESAGQIPSWTTVTSVVPVSSAAGSAAGGCGLGSGGADFDAIAQSVGAQAFPGVDFSGASANHLLIVVPSGCGGGTTGRARVGDSFASGGPAIVQGMTPVKTLSTLNHEWGHNVGLQHANNSTEYGDLYEVMGADDGTWKSPALGTVYRWEQGVIGTGEVVDGTPGGTWALQPRSATSGLRGVVFINPDNGRRTFIDYRNGAGTDAGTCYAAGSTTCNYGNGGSYGQAYSAGITVERENDRSGAALLVGGDGALQAGESWTSGRVTVTAASASTVSLGFAPASGTVAGGTASMTAPTALRQVSAVGSGFSPAPAGYRYQWAINGQPIPNAEDATFTPSAAMAGGALTVTVTAYAPGSNPAARTSAPQTVAPAAWYATGTQRYPTISGSTRVGATLTATGINWVDYYGNRPAGYAPVYQWSRNGSVIKGATASTYRLTAKDLKKTIQVTEYPRATGFATSNYARSDATAKIRIGKLTSPRPRIKGKVKVGKTVKATTKGWNTGTKFRYQWFLGKRTIKGATTKKLHVTRSMRGKKLVLKVTGTKKGYNKVSARSRPSKVR